MAVEATGKLYKAHKLIAAFVLMIGLFFLLPESTRTWGGLLAFVGVVWFLAAGFAAWWHHG